MYEFRCALSKGDVLPQFKIGENHYFFQQRWCKFWRKQSLKLSKNIDGNEKIVRQRYERIILYVEKLWKEFDEIIKKKNFGAGSASEERYFGT